MARQNKRRTRGSPGVNAPIYSFRFVVTAMLVFVGCITIVVVSSALSRRGNDKIEYKNANNRLFSSPDQIPRDILRKFDAVIVLGGGVPDSLELPPIYVQQRADDAAKVVREYQGISSKTKSRAIQDHSLPILCLSAGTAHLPQLLSPDGLPIWESTSCAAYLAAQHNLVDDVFVETTSYDTIGNAFFTRTSHTDVNGWRRLLVITNEFHMSRTAAIFDWIFLGCSQKSGKNGRQKRDDTYELYYLSSQNVGLSEDAINARREREEQSAKNVRENLAKKYTTMAKVWKFLNSEHSLYTASKLVERGRGSGVDGGASEMVKKSYGLKDDTNGS
jgi:uncharacterized SAM-binding protein YcdF (DUF218 family)